jgi:hypothetical protein
MATPRDAIEVAIAKIPIPMAAIAKVADNVMLFIAEVILPVIAVIEPLDLLATLSVMAVNDLALFAAA